MKTMKTYQMLARVFHQEGVGACFNLLGDANMNWAAALAELGVPMIYVRHEHCAVSAAMAYVRKTDDVGVASMTCGPGLTQVLTALTAAVRARLPMVVFAGEAPLKSGWYNQGIEQAPFVVAAGAEYRCLHHVRRMPEAIRDAFLDARMQRRPIVLGVPMDLQDTDWSGEDALPTPSSILVPAMEPIPPHPDDLARAVALIDRSRRILVMAGIGVAHARAAHACRLLAQKCDALTATTLPGRGLFHDDPYCLGVAGGYTPEAMRPYFEDADLVIGLGTSLARHNADDGRLFPHATVLHVDIEPVSISQARVAAQHHLRADARLGAEALYAAITTKPTERRIPTMAQGIANVPLDTREIALEPGVNHPADVVEALDASLPKDWQVVNAAGHCAFYFTNMRGRPHDKFMTIREFGAIGNGTSYAIGAATACPNETVVVFDGDGGLLMHIQELETMRRHGMNILICVLNDGAYGSEIHKLRSLGMPDEGASFGRPDFAAIARGFGVQGECVTDLSRLPSLVAAFDRDGGCAVWDFPISNRVTSPQMRRAHPHVGTWVSSGLVQEK